MTGPDPTAAVWSGTLADRGARVLLPTYARYPIEVAGGRGCRVVDSAGREYLDFVAGIAVNALGHAHPTVVAAAQRAAEGVVHVSNLYWTEPMVRLAERLTAAAGMDRAFFCNSGAEACEAAIKLARRARPGRPALVAFDRSFHGRTLGALSVTGQTKYREPFEPLIPAVRIVEFGDPRAARAAIDESVCAVFVEVVQGEGGVRPAPPGFLKALRVACDAAGAMLIVDEVQTGIGRTGRMFAYQGEDVVPDAVTCAKGLGGGFPIGALLARGEAAAALQPGDHGSTFGGGPFVTTVANAVLDVVLGEGFLDTVRESGARLEAGLDGLARRRAERIAEPRGRGLMRGIALRTPEAPAIVDRLRELGMLAVPAGPDVVRLLPPLTVTVEDLDRALELLDHAFEAPS